MRAAVVILVLVGTASVVHAHVTVLPRESQAGADWVGIAGDRRPASVTTLTMAR